MAIHLIVVKPFERFVRGDIIADASKVTGILKSQHRSFVIRVAQRMTSKD